MSHKEKKPVYTKNSEITEKVIDCHAHLDYYDRLERAEILNNMNEDGLDKIVSIGTSVKATRIVRKIIKNNENIYYTIGYHPHQSRKYNFLYKAYVKWLYRKDKRTQNRLVGIGEIGLDYSEGEKQVDKNLQKRVLLEQIDIAEELKLPIVFHIRDAYSDAVSLFKELQAKGKLKGNCVIHCFSGTKEEAEEYIKMGFYIGLSGSSTYTNRANENERKEMIKSLPIDKILTETDAPYLSPAPYRGVKNYPKMTLVVAEFIANALSMDTNSFIKKASENARRFYGINE